ncbi:hypothetical protein PMAYCL1PPCAC_16420, partial [Pristionchus mayeri]
NIRLFCGLVGLSTFLLNVFCLHLIVKHRSTFAANIYIITLLLQTLYLLINLHFNIFSIPFIYARYGGGYCVGILCNYVSLLVQATYIYLMTAISRLFVLLMFFRHQALMCFEIKFRLSGAYLKAWQAFAQHRLTESEANRTMATVAFKYASQHSVHTLQNCKSCDWVEKSRNYGVISISDAIVSFLSVF